MILHSLFTVAQTLTGSSIYIGLEAYLAKLEEKKIVLEELLAHYNDGRRKTFLLQRCISYPWKICAL